MKSVLIVCVGNICRSPMAVAALRRHVPDQVLVSSAGLAARAGDGVHPIAADVLKAHGLALDDHVARQLRPEMIDAADLVLTMEQRHANALRAIAPGVRHRLHLMGRWDGNREVRDPCGRPRAAFEQAFAEIESFARRWGEEISRA